MAQVIIVKGLSSSTDQIIGDTSDRKAGMALRIQNGNFNYFNGFTTGNNQISITANDNQNLHFYGRDTSSNFYARLNGSETSSVITAINTAAQNIYLGARHDGSLDLDGAMQEYILYVTSKSADKTSIEENVGDYFTQNTPLLDTYSGAAAAYSLRLLDSTYTGSAIRVRRSSDNTEQDINFNVFGELDTVSLTAFAGTGDAFVKTWYDQSGNSKDATQTTTASQPQIVSSGAVIVENGKPAVQFDGANDFMLSALQFTNTDKTIEIVYTPEESASFAFGILNVNTITRARFYLQTGSATANFVEGNPGVFNSVSSTQTQQLFYMDWTNSNYQFNFAADGNTVSSATGNANTPVGVKYMLGAINNGGDGPFGSALGKYQEVIIYDSDESANRTDIETNINTFYNIY